MFLLKETMPLMIQSSWQSLMLTQSGGATYTDTKARFLLIIYHWLTYQYNLTCQKDRPGGWNG